MNVKLCDCVYFERLKQHGVVVGFNGDALIDFGEGFIGHGGHNDIYHRRTCYYISTDYLEPATEIIDVEKFTGLNLS